MFVSEEIVSVIKQKLDEIEEKEYDYDEDREIWTNYEEDDQEYGYYEDVYDW